MKCEWVKENVLLYVYNELPDDARYELEQHLARCADCTAELKTTRKFHTMLSELPVEEPSPNLVAASRMRLQEGLETAQQGRFWHRLIFDPAAWLRHGSRPPAGADRGAGAAHRCRRGAVRRPRRAWCPASRAGSRSSRAQAAGIVSKTHDPQHALRVDKVGMTGFNAVWEKAEHLPSLAEIHDPDSWVARVHP